MIACTVIARNYLAQARVFARSFLDHHPAGSVVVLVLDDPAGEIGPGEAFTVLSPDAVLPRDEFHRMATSYGIVELATAVKPALLRHLLADAPVVAYFDPDIQVFGCLDDVFGAAAEHGIALTPHALTPLPRDGDSTSTEDVILDAGVFNLGFIAVGQCPEALSWWDERLRRECIIDPPNSRFVDQRWVDLFPAYFTPVILRDPGLNIAWWNAPTRYVTGGPGAYLVNGAPLRFFHFSGYDPRRPWMLSTHQGPIPRMLLSERGDLVPITSAYRSLVLGAGYEKWQQREYGLATTPGGLRLDHRMRRIYREALLRTERCGEPEPPNPFTAGDRAFLEWLATPDIPTGGPWPLSRLVRSIWEEAPDLRARFPDPHRDDAAGMLTWAGTTAVESGVLPEAFAFLLPAIAEPSHTTAFAVGIHVIAPFGDESDHDVIAQRLVAAAAQMGIATSVTALPAPGRTDSPVTTRDWGDLQLRTINIFVTGASRVAEAIHALPPVVVMAPRSYALIHDPMDAYQPIPDACAHFVDALWACSQAHAEALRAAHPDTAVAVAPIPSIPPAGCDVDSTRRGVVAIGDGLAALEHPAIDPDTPLLIALGGNDQTSEGEERIRWAARDRPNVTVQRVPPAELRAVLVHAEAVLALGDLSDPPLALLDAISSGTRVITDDPAVLPSITTSADCGTFLRQILDDALHADADAASVPPPRWWLHRR